MVDPSEGRAKVVELDINGKQAEGPRRFVHINRRAEGDLSLFHDHINARPVTEIYVQMRPAYLRKILTDSREHQRAKDDVRRAVASAGNDSINLLRVGMENLPVPNEPPEDSGPHGPPTVPAVTKLFDLCDVNGVDAISMPTPTTHTLQWARMTSNIFRTRRPDFLREVIWFGSIPISLPQTDAANLLKHYYSEGYEAIYVDFLARKVPESWVRGLVDVNEARWAQLCLAGGNVLADVSQGTWRRRIIPNYDVLTQVYGFDAFANLRMGMGGDFEGTTTEKFEAMRVRGRYRITDTYGAYNLEGLRVFHENDGVHRCPCPTCHNDNPEAIYGRFHASQDGVESLRKALRAHRTYVTHTEMLELNRVIQAETYGEHIARKVEATNEIASILRAVGH